MRHCDHMQGTNVGTYILYIPLTYVRMYIHKYTYSMSAAFTVFLVVAIFTVNMHTKEVRAPHPIVVFS